MIMAWTRSSLGVQSDNSQVRSRRARPVGTGTGTGATFTWSLHRSGGLERFVCSLVEQHEPHDGDARCVDRWS